MCLSSLLNTYIFTLKCFEKPASNTQLSKLKRSLFQFLGPHATGSCSLLMPWLKAPVDGADAEPDIILKPRSRLIMLACHLAVIMPHSCDPLAVSAKARSAQTGSIGSINGGSGWSTALQVFAMCQALADSLPTSAATSAAAKVDALHSPAAWNAPPIALPKVRLNPLQQCFSCGFCKSLFDSPIGLYVLH